MNRHYELPRRFSDLIARDVNQPGRSASRSARARASRSAAVTLSGDRKISRQAIASLLTLRRFVTAAAFRRSKTSSEMFFRVSVALASRSYDIGGGASERGHGARFDEARERLR